MIDSVVSFHVNPYTCGVARFNKSLAEELGVPLVELSAYVASPTANALLSIKLVEIEPAVLADLARVVGKIPTFDMFWHDLDESPLELELLTRARRNFTGNSEMARVLASRSISATPLFAPGVPVVPDDADVDLTLLTFGMAHKVRAERYRQLGVLLARDSRTARLEISTALHEGTTFSEEFFSVNSDISRVFEGRVSFLGFLADDEVSRRLRRAHAMVAFFPRGARENNTSILAALNHGCALITNLDEESPEWLMHGETCFDIDLLTTFPTVDELAEVGRAGRKAAESFTYKTLAEILRS
jgi:hypothetical protein